MSNVNGDINALHRQDKEDNWSLGEAAHLVSRQPDVSKHTSRYFSFIFGDGSYDIVFVALCNALCMCQLVG